MENEKNYFLVILKDGKSFSLDTEDVFEIASMLKRSKFIMCRERGCKHSREDDYSLINVDEIKMVIPHNFYD